VRAGSRAAGGEGPPELGRRDGHGVGAHARLVGVEADAPEATRVVEQEFPLVEADPEADPGGAEGAR